MGLILSSEVVVKNRTNHVDELFRQIQNSNLTTTEILQLKHRLEALLHTMQEAELNGHFTGLESKADNIESKVDNVESKVDNANRAMTADFASIEMKLQHQIAQNAVLIWQSTLRTRQLAELKASLLELNEI